MTADEIADKAMKLVMDGGDYRVDERRKALQRLLFDCEAQASREIADAGFGRAANRLYALAATTSDKTKKGLLRQGAQDCAHFWSRTQS